MQKLTNKMRKIFYHLFVRKVFTISTFVALCTLSVLGQLLDDICPITDANSSACVEYSREMTKQCLATQSHKAVVPNRISRQGLLSIISQQIKLVSLGNTDNAKQEQQSGLSPSALRNSVSYQPCDKSTVMETIDMEAPNYMPLGVIVTKEIFGNIKSNNPCERWQLKLAKVEETQKRSSEIFEPDFLPKADRILNQYAQYFTCLININCEGGNQK